MRMTTARLWLSTMKRVWILGVLRRECRSRASILPFLRGPASLLWTLFPSKLSLSLSLSLLW